MKETIEKAPEKQGVLSRAANWLKGNFLVEKSEASRVALNGLIYQNPTFVLLLGMCPTMATTCLLYTSPVMMTPTFFAWYGRRAKSLLSAHNCSARMICSSRVTRGTIRMEAIRAPALTG